MTEVVAMRNSVIGCDDKGVATLELINARVEVTAGSKDIAISTNDGYELITAPATDKKPSRGAFASGDDKKANLNGVTVQQALDGHLILTVPEDKEVVNTLPAKEYEAGQLTENGIFIATSIDANGNTIGWFADREDVQDADGKRLRKSFNEAATIAAELNKQNHHGHDDWVVAPTLGYKKGSFDALKAMFAERTAIGGFAEGETYWSSTPVFATHSEHKQAVDVETGTRSAVDQKSALPFRLVRSVVL